MGVADDATRTLAKMSPRKRKAEELDEASSRSPPSLLRTFLRDLVL